MSFLSRFSSRTKDRPARSSKRSASNPSTQKDRQDLLPLTLPTSSLLADASLANPLLLSSPSSHSAARDDDLRSLRSVDTTPWVHLDADSPVKPRPQQPLRPAVDPAREKRERIRLEKARLSPGEVTLLIEECGSVIRSRGLTTLGLFRPFRASEFRPAIRALCLGFLDYVAECAARPTATDDARGTEASKAVLLHAFREELRYAGVHDVVAVLKWGLRHLTYPPGTSFSGPSPPSLAWYTTFLARTTPTSPPHAFSAFLLPSLPPPSQSLLLAALTLIQAVAAHAQENAMPSHRLCRLFAAHLFGLAPASCPSFDEAQRTWREAGAALEGCLRAFLAGQADLPPRLAELLDPRPGAAGAQSENRTVRVLRVELETRGEWDAAGTGVEGVNDQATGRAAAPGDKPARRKPLEVLRSALRVGAPAPAAAGEDDAAAQAWASLRALAAEEEEGKGDEGAEALLDEETLRVLDLLGLGAAGEPDDTPFALLVPGADARVRTQSHGEGAAAASELGALGARFPNRSAGTLLAPQAPASWDAFASSGFAPAPSGEFGLLSSSQLLSRAEALALATRRARPAPQSTLLRVRLDSVDDALADAWLDSLEETRSALGPCAGWPSIVLAPLRRGPAACAGNGVEHLLVVEVLLPLPQRMLAPPQQQQHPGLLRAPSSASSRPGTLGDGALTAGRKWRRRASAIFSPSSTSLVDEGDGGVDGGLLPAARRSRKSLGRPSTAQAERAPPIPAIASSSGGGPGTFVRSLSQGFASARRKGSRQSMYGGGMTSPLEEEVPPPPLPEKAASPHVEQQGEEEEDEVRGYEVVTPQGSQVVERSLAPEGAAFDRQHEEEEATRPGMPPGLGRVAVPSPVMEEPELPLEDERADFERETLHPPTAVDPLTGSPTHLDAHPLAPLGAAPFANLSAIDAPGAEPLAAAGAPQLERAAAADDPAAAVERAAELDEPHVLLPQDDPSPVVEHESHALGRTEEEPPLPQEPETADLLAVTEAEELVATAPLEEEDVAAPAALQDVAHTPLELEQHNEPSIDQLDPVPQPEASSPRADSLAVEQGETIAPATPTSPLVTLSPLPPEEEEETKELPSVPEEHGRDDEPAVEQNEHTEAPKPAPLGVAMGLGLVNAPIQPVEPEPASAPPATPKKDDLRSPAANPQTPHTLASPSLSAAAAHSPALSQGSQSSFGIPKSPTPSSSSTGSRKFLASVGGFLKRKKSTVDKEQARREKADAAREKEEQKQLRKLREEELRREIKERKAPTPVSNVKARVREIEEEHAAVSAAPTSPATPSRVRTASSSTSPRPGTPTRSVSRHASVTSLRAHSSAPAVPPPDEPLPALPVGAAPAEAPAQAEAHAERLEALIPSDTVLHAAEEPSTLLAPEPVDDEERTGIIAQPSALTPVQESQHLQVKVPSSLDDLPSPIPSPTPQTAEPHNNSLVVGDDDHTAPLPDLAPPVFAVTAPAPLDDDAVDDEDTAPAAGEEHTAVLPLLDVSSPVPAQTPEHLHVKVPSAFADLPPAAPSPTPRGEDDEGDVLVEDVMETIPDLRPPVFAPAGLAGLAASTAGGAELEEPAALAGNGQHTERVEEVEHVEQVERVEQVEPDSSLAGEPASPDGHAQTNGHAKEASVDTVVPAIDAVEGEVHSPTNEPSAPHAHEPPVTPSKPSSTAQNGTPVAHATPTASAVHDDVFFAPPSSAADATPTKPAPSPLPQVVRSSASQHSLSTTRSFETADSSAQSSMTTNEHWEPSEETF